MIPQDYDLIYLEDAGNTCDLADEVGTQGRGLRDFEDRIRKANSQVGQFAVDTFLLLSLLFVDDSILPVLTGIVIFNE
jgi:hypothetical protein